jgi:VanZ family protein
MAVVFRLVPASLVTVVILVASYLPPGLVAPEVADRLVGWDKVGHVVCYGVLAWLLARGLTGFGRLHAALASLLLVMAIGGIAELTQPWAGRTCALADWLSSVAGACLAIPLWLIKTRPAPTCPGR